MWCLSNVLIIFMLVLPAHGVAATLGPLVTWSIPSNVNATSRQMHSHRRGIEAVECTTTTTVSVTLNRATGHEIRSTTYTSTITEWISLHCGGCAHIASVTHYYLGQANPVHVEPAIVQTFRVLVISREATVTKGYCGKSPPNSFQRLPAMRRIGISDEYGI